MRKLLSRACKIAGRRDQLADATLRAHAYKLDAELDALLRTSPTHGAGNQPQGVIKGCRRHMLVFLAKRAIPPTNNGSEQALRPCVIFRKVTNCFRSEWAAQLYADIRSVIETARRRAIGALGIWRRGKTSVDRMMWGSIVKPFTDRQLDLVKKALAMATFAIELQPGPSRST